MDHNVDHLPVWAHAPVTAHSPELAALLSFIGEGASDRDRERTLPFPVIDAIRSAPVVVVPPTANCSRP
jgi:hypothetical protein